MSLLRCNHRNEIINAWLPRNLEVVRKKTIKKIIEFFIFSHKKIFSWINKYFLYPATAKTGAAPPS